MIFDKYIALIIESIERHSALTLTELREQNRILQTEIGALSKRFTETEEETASKKQLYDKIVELEEKNRELEQENRTLEDVAEDASREYEETKEKWESLSEAFKELEENSDNMSDEYFEREKRASEKLNEQRSTIAQLERKIKDIEVALENAAQRNTAAQAKQDRLLQLVKEYDKATVNMLNAILERRSSIEERAIWEDAKEALKGWDSPVVKRKPGRPKKQS